MEIKPLIYIAGAISPTDPNKHPLLEWGENFDRFLKADIKLRKLGFAPYNPSLDYMLLMYAAELDITPKFFYSVSLSVLSKCEAMFVLKGWNNSKGTQKEIWFCEKNGIKIFFEELNGYKEIEKYFKERSKKDETKKKNRTEVPLLRKKA